MSLQSQLNVQAINSLTKVKAFIASADQFERNQMINLTLQRFNSSFVPVSEMTTQQLSSFEEELLISFEYRDLI